MSEPELTPEQQKRMNSLDEEECDYHNRYMFLMDKISSYIKRNQEVPSKLLRELEILSEGRDELHKEILKFLDSVK